MKFGFLTSQPRKKTKQKKELKYIDIRRFQYGARNEHYYCQNKKYNRTTNTITNNNAGGKWKYGHKADT